LEWLADQGALSIPQMVDRFGVSAMTIHRDLDMLAGQGDVRKVRGGVLPGDHTGSRQRSLRHLRQAGAGSHPVGINTRRWGSAAMPVVLIAGCYTLTQNPRPQSALATDFLYGRMVNVFQASYVIGSDVGVCCVPSALCFALRVDAERFSNQGLVGKSWISAEAKAAMSRMHHTVDRD
jgi:hypothetical protein